MSRGYSFVDDRHQRLGHRRRVVVLDDVAAVDDAGRALGHHRLRPAQDRLVGRSTTAAHEHRDVTGDLDHAAIVVEIVRRVGLDHVGSELDRLPDERHDLLNVAVDAVGAPLARLHHERLDHQRHTNRVAGGA